tara:strand:+ start:22 stop:129 length:108 start_codon:yes stop_codon:yes gene_type:complete
MRLAIFAGDEEVAEINHKKKLAFFSLYGCMIYVGY